MVAEWNEQSKAVCDTWTNYTVKTEQYREAILEKELAFAKSHGATAWIMDARIAKGAFSQEILALIQAEVFKAFAAAGIKYFITLKSGSAITNMTINAYSVHAGPAGIKLVDLPDMPEAVKWLKAQK
jgi:hypothetical protein